MRDTDPVHVRIFAPPPDHLAFFLGGRDLEMETIRGLLEEGAPGRFFDKGLDWGARASSYAEEVAWAIKRRLVPVFVELTNDLELKDEAPILVDHHGPLAGRDEETSLRYVFDLLEWPDERWSRWMELVEANDRGHVRGMLEAGATPEELVLVRARDRAAQGTTEEEESEGQRAALAAELRPGGRLTLARLGHERTATVADRLDRDLGGPGVGDLLVVTPKGAHFFGKGEVVLWLAQRWPEGSWFGGALPDYGFWGADLDGDEVLRGLEAEGPRP